MELEPWQALELMLERRAGQVLELMSKREPGLALGRMSDRGPMQALAVLLALGFRRLYRCHLPAQCPLRLDRTRPGRARLHTKS